MREISNVLAQLVPVTRFTESTHWNHDIRGWISMQDFRISSGIGAGSFVLDPNDWSSVERSLGIEANRFFVGAIESVDGVRRDPNLTSSFAWQVVRSYYAAFYSAHALLRIYGYSLTHLSNAFGSKIYEVANLLGQTNGVSKINEGYYFAIFDADSRTVTFQRVSESHADTWSSLLKLIDVLELESSRVTALSSHRLMASNFLTELKSCLTHDHCGRGNWLSKIRNSVNYKFSHNVWFPHGTKDVSVDFAESRAEYWSDATRNLTYSHRTPLLRMFFETCFALVTLCQCVFRTAINRFSNRPQYITQGSLQLLNQLNIGLEI